MMIISAEVTVNSIWDTRNRYDGMMLNRNSQYYSVVIHWSPAFIAIQSADIQSEQTRIWPFQNKLDVCVHPKRTHEGENIWRRESNIQDIRL